MKIYKLTRTDNVSYDEFDSCVVIATGEDDAKSIEPNGEKFDPNKQLSDWATDLADITVYYIGEADINQKRGVVCASFNAG